MKRISPEDMFALKEGYRIKLKDDSEIILTSNYIPETLSYNYDKVVCENGVEKITEGGTISCRKIIGCYIS